MSTPFFFPDNTALINFHILGRWDLLNTVVGINRHWCGTVSAECDDWTHKQYAGMYDEAESIFGKPLYPEGAEYTDAQTFRLNMADPTNDSPKRHLGEAETIAIATSRFGSGARFVTDDQGARDFAEGNGLTCYGTGDVLYVAERALKTITAQQHAAMAQILRAASRGVKYFKFTG